MIKCHTVLVTYKGTNYPSIASVEFTSSATDGAAWFEVTKEDGFLVLRATNKNGWSLKVYNINLQDVKEYILTGISNTQESPPTPPVIILPHPVEIAASRGF